MLTASEGGIYGRFGFGVATPGARASSCARDARSRSPHPVTDGRRAHGRAGGEREGRARAVRPRPRATRNGAVSRPAVVVGRRVGAEGAREAPLRRRLRARRSGRGLRGLQRRGTWNDGFSDKTRRGARPRRGHARGRGRAVAVPVRHRPRPAGSPTGTSPPDIELPWRLRDTRQMRTTSLRDWLWLRPVDVPALPRRPHATPTGGAAGARGARRDAARRRRGRPVPCSTAGRTARRARAPTRRRTSCSTWPRSARSRSAGSPPSTLARAGPIEEQTPGALLTADRMFAADRGPVRFTWF